jgi:hypothetical protein
MKEDEFVYGACDSRETVQKYKKEMLVWERIYYLGSPRPTRGDDIKHES